MKKFAAVLTTCAVLATGVVCEAVDTVRLAKGGQIGRIARMTSTEVEVESSSGAMKTFPVNEIVSITFDEEPRQMNEGRKLIAEGKYKDALAQFEAAAPKARRDIVKQDVEFYKAYCKAQMALFGSEDIMAAARLMGEFINENKTNFHWLQANQVMGDLAVASGNAQAAAKFYDKVSAAPWPDYAMRAGIAFGRALLAQDKPAEALKQFEEVLSKTGGGEQVQVQRAAATIGKLRCQAADKDKAEEVIKEVTALLAKTDSDQGDVLANAYNALGTAYRTLGRNTEAIHAFLHVELLYPGQADAYAEAIGNLMSLWKAENKFDREQRARQVLEERFPKSVWLKKQG